MKTKSTYSDAVHWLRLWLHCLWFRESTSSDSKKECFVSCGVSQSVFYRDAKTIKISSVLCPYELLDLISFFLLENRITICVVSGRLTQSWLGPSKWALNQKSKTLSISHFFKRQESTSTSGLNDWQPRVSLYESDKASAVNFRMQRRCCSLTQRIF